ncbi:MAG: ROK family glucokinase [Lachnospiraceae bacterium]|nr:ROK family glucokinase [Lachnospiraceae bacterium]
MKYCFGIDVGGTTVKLGLFDVEGNVLDKWEIPTRSENGGVNVLPDIAEAVKNKMEQRNLAKEDVAGAGIGVPGPVSSDGFVNKAVNLGWKERFNVEDKLSALIDMPVKAGNDANVAALGEMWKGGGAGAENVVFVTLGTGVGGGIIIDGKIVTGSHGAGGEIGHIHVEDKEEESCGCGNHGCLEQYASATGVVRIANKLLKETEQDSVLRSGEVSAKTIFDAVKAGDALAVKVAEQFGKYLGTALANISAIADPQVFVIGGGVSKAGEVLLDYVKKYYVPTVFHGCRETRFELATLGNDAGIYGTARLILDK